MDEIPLVLATIKRLAHKRGLSINLLADFSGLDRGHVSRLLRGEKSPTLRTLKKLADTLELSLFELFEIAGRKKDE